MDGPSGIEGKQTNRRSADPHFDPGWGGRTRPWSQAGWRDRTPTGRLAGMAPVDRESDGSSTPEGVPRVKSSGLAKMRFRGRQAPELGQRAAH